MSALPRPHLPAGPHHDLVDALHELHHRAGWPSLRTLARQSGVSHTTVSKVFSAPALPTWGTLELLVEAMDGDTARFHQRWLDATTPTSPTMTATEPRIAGRRAELDVVRRHLEAGSGLLLVAGEAGIGKSALVGAATAAADTAVAMGTCLPLTIEAPLLPVADCLHSLLDADAARFAEALAACPPYTSDALAPLVPEVSHAPVRAGDRRPMFGAVGALLRALAADRPVALVLEDLHWADAGTLDLVEHLLGRSLAVPILGTWRSGDPATSEASEDWLARVRRFPTTGWLALGPLTRSESAEQLRLLGATPDRLDRIHARSQGQPLFTEQLAALIDDEEGLPDLLADLLDRRLRGLTETEWAVLRALGVAARPLAPSLLAAASSLTAADLTHQLRSLHGRRLVRRVERAADLQHPLLVDAVRRRLVPGEDTAAHAAFAKALEDTADPEPAEVAGHWRRAEEPAHELDWRVAAARAAEARFDRGQAADHWLRALDIWPDRDAKRGDPPISRAEAYVAATEALRTSFQWERAADMSERAEDVLGEVEDHVRAELLFRAAEYRGEREGVDVARALIDEALALYDKLPVSSGKVRALDWHQNLLRSLGDYAGSRVSQRAALEAAEELGDPVLLRDCLMRIAWQAGIEGGLSEGLTMLDEATAHAGAAQDPLGDVRRAVYATDMLLICGGSADEVVAAGLEGLAVARELDLDTFHVLLLRYNMAYALLLAGRLEEAEDVLDTPTDQSLDLERWPMHALRAAIDSVRGRPLEAHRRMAEITHHLAPGHETDVEYAVTMGTVACWAGMPEEPLSRLVTGLPTLVDTAPLRIVAPGVLLAARAAADLAESDPTHTAGHVETVRELVARSGLLDQRHGTDPYLAAHAATLVPELARPAQRDRAEWWVDAASAWDVLDRPHDAAYCRWRGAQAALREGQGTLAARLLKRAAADAREHVPLSRAIAETVVVTR